jgi:very-short-patch-repair endonuclease
MSQGCLAALFGIKEKASPAAPVSSGYPYALRNYLLTKAENSFYHVLKSALPAGSVIMCKVRLSDVLFVERNEGGKADWNRINQKHIDFLICEEGALRPRLAIELDDASHQSERAIDRDEFLVGALDAAGLPLLRIRAARTYVAQDLRRDLAELL